MGNAIANLHWFKCIMVYIRMGWKYLASSILILTSLRKAHIKPEAIMLHHTQVLSRLPRYSWPLVESTSPVLSCASHMLQQTGSITPHLLFSHETTKVVAVDKIAAWRGRLVACLLCIIIYVKNYNLIKHMLVHINYSGVTTVRKVLPSIIIC